MSILKWRDDVYRDIIEKIEMVPGLSDLIDQLTNALNACEFEFSVSLSISQNVKDLY